MKRLAAAGAVLGLLVALTGCGSAGGAANAAEDVPALAAGLTRVDAAIAAHRYDVARSQLRALITATTGARDDGRLDAARAESILAAAGRLLAALPETTPRPTLTPTPKPTPKATSGSSKGDDEKHRGKGKGRDRSD